MGSLPLVTTLCTLCGMADRLATGTVGRVKLALEPEEYPVVLAEDGAAPSMGNIASGREIPIESLKLSSSVGVEAQSGRKGEP